MSNINTVLQKFWKVDCSAIEGTPLSCHRILWRNFNIDHEPTVYEFDRLVFGLNCSPFLAQLVSHHRAKLCKQKYPMASETIF